MNRDSSIDLGKGLAILFVYLGHSVIYYPIQLANMYSWCNRLGLCVLSFNMPMFFLISGYLFSKTNKSTMDLYWGKTKRILIPYLFTMAILVIVKLFLPTSLSYNTAAGGGISSLILNALCYGGDRWFVYTLYIIFLLLIPIKNILKKKWLDSLLIVLLIGIYFLDFMPTMFALDNVFYFMTFFIVGYMLKDGYMVIRDWAMRYWLLIYLLFIVVNIVFIDILYNITFVFRFILPFTGTLAVMTLAFQIEESIEKNKLVQYVEYVGKYSLQFYLFTFCYPIIRSVIVSVMHVTNPVVILVSVFVLQLLTSTIIVEVTRRIKWLKIPCGY